MAEQQKGAEAAGGVQQAVDVCDRVRRCPDAAIAFARIFFDELALGLGAFDGVREREEARRAEIVREVLQAVCAVLDRLIASKRLLRIKPDLYMHADVVAELRTKLIAFLDAHKTIDAQQWKDLTGASRKFTIPLAEYFDAEKLTLRVGDVRRKR